MPIFKTKITEDGRVVIPPEYLEHLGLQPGNKVIMQLKDMAAPRCAIGNSNFYSRSGDRTLVKFA